MATTYSLTPTETVTVRRHDAEALEVEVAYAAGGAPPPPHLHPAQDERFEVLAGTVHAEVDGTAHVLRAGDALDIPRGAVHKLWNGGDGTARAIWETTPAGRTLEWFAVLDHAGRTQAAGGDRLPNPFALAVLLTEYRDVLQLAQRPRWLVTAVLAVMAAVGGRRRLAGAPSTA